MTSTDDASLRRLSAVLFADVTGYSKRMGEDETGAIAAVGRVRKVFGDVVPKHAGTLEVAVGDCFVALFGSAVDALQAAVAIQSELAQADDPMRIRIGLHLGEVVRTDAGLFGDCINIAARIQTLAPPGGVTCSGDVYRAVRAKVTLPFRDTGLQRLKNIREPMRVFALAPDTSVRIRPAPQRKHLAWGGIAGVAVALALVVAGWLGLRQPATRPAAVTPSPATPLAVGVMGFQARGDVPDWMREVTRDGLNTILTKIPALQVYSKQKIDFLREKRGLTELEVAEQLGITKMISGTVTQKGAAVSLEVQVVDTGSGLLDAGEHVEGKADDLIELQNRLAVNMLTALKVSLTPEEVGTLFAKRTNDTLDAYRLLNDALGGMDAEPEPTPPPKREKGAWWSTATAHADTGADDAAIRALLEQYREALEAESMDGLAAVHVELKAAQRAALTRYFDSTEKLTVQFAKVDVLIEGDDALASFTRQDDFTDARSGRPQHLEVRVSCILVRRPEGWRVVGLKRPD